jgi:hypothetical protein
MDKQYEVTLHGDLHGTRRFPFIHQAMAYIARIGPDPEDDRIVVWEVLDTGHKKPIWHFSGWHWDPDAHDLFEHPEPQGKLPGHSKSLYEEVMEDY